MTKVYTSIVHIYNSPFTTTYIPPGLQDGNSHVVKLCEYNGPVQVSPLLKVTVRSTSLSNPF